MGFHSDDICEPNTNTATSIPNIGRVSKRSRDFIILFLTRMFVDVIEIAVAPVQTI